MKDSGQLHTKLSGSMTSPLLKGIVRLDGNKPSLPKEEPKLTASPKEESTITIPHVHMISFLILLNFTALIYGATALAFTSLWVWLTGLPYPMELNYVLAAIGMAMAVSATSLFMIYRTSS